MKGNFHVQFLGGWGAAMLPGYPARTEKEPEGQPEATSPAAYPTRETRMGLSGCLAPRRPGCLINRQFTGRVWRSHRRAIVETALASSVEAIYRRVAEDLRPFVDWLPARSGVRTLARGVLPWIPIEICCLV
jgi:hypothetical protein